MRFLIGFKRMDCPCCDKIHFVRKYAELTDIEVKGKTVKYWLVRYFCNNSPYEDLQWFQTGGIVNKELARIRKKTARKGLM